MVWFAETLKRLIDDRMSHDAVAKMFRLFTVRMMPCTHVAPFFLLHSRFA